MSNRMNIVWMEKHGAMINALDGLEDVASEQTLAPIVSRDRELDTVGKRLVRTLIDQRHPRGRHYFTSTGAPRFRRVRTFAGSG